MSQKNRSYKRQVKLYVRYHDLVMENSSQRDDHNRSNDIDIGLGTNEVGNRDLFKECEGNEGAKMNKGVFANGDNDSKMMMEIRPTVIDDDGCAFVVFDEELVSKGSNMWKLTVDSMMSVFSSLKKKRIDPNIGLERKEETEIPLWAKIKNVSLKAWTKDGINALASSLGKTLKWIRRNRLMQSELVRAELEFDSNVEKSNNVDIIDESSGRSKEDEGFMEVREPDTSYPVEVDTPYSTVD
ncbi:zinc knuckle CX2CX4HX4C containing protein [Tanacetum coccineum]